jgi:hypothetical protein
MDPNVALEILRAAVRKIQQNPEEGLELEEIIEMAETFDGLDKWLANGGFLPKEWETYD